MSEFLSKFLDNYLFERTGRLYEYTGSTGKQAVFSDITDGEPVYVNVDDIGTYFTSTVERTPHEEIIRA